MDLLHLLLASIIMPNNVGTIVGNIMNGPVPSTSYHFKVSNVEIKIVGIFYYDQSVFNFQLNLNVAVSLDLIDFPSTNHICS